MIERHRLKLQEVSPVPYSAALALQGRTVARPHHSPELDQNRFLRSEICTGVECASNPHEHRPSQVKEPRLNVFQGHSWSEIVLNLQKECVLIQASATAI